MNIKRIAPAVSLLWLLAPDDAVAQTSCWECFNLGGSPVYQYCQPGEMGKECTQYYQNPDTYCNTYGGECGDTTIQDPGGFLPSDLTPVGTYAVASEPSIDEAGRQRCTGFLVRFPPVPFEKPRGWTPTPVRPFTLVL